MDYSQLKVTGTTAPRTTHDIGKLVDSEDVDLLLLANVLGCLKFGGGGGFDWLEV